jgi:hypothetical protein
MPKRRIINGLPHNLTKSYFGTLRYYGKGYMADWLLNAAKILDVDHVTLDIMKLTINPKEMESLPLMYHLEDLNAIIHKELSRNGFDRDFIVSAKIEIRIPERNIYGRTIYCYPELVDKMGRRYVHGRITETAYEYAFNPFEERTLFTSIFAKFRRLFKPLFKT